MTNTTTLYLVLPEVILVAVATMIYVVGALVRLREVAGWAAGWAVLVAGAVLYVQDQQLEVFADLTVAWSSGPMMIDSFGHIVRWGTLAVGLLLVLLMAGRSESGQEAEEAGSLLLILAGLMLAVTSDDLILIFVGLELVSIPTYVLLYIGRHDASGQEAASKYFFLSILSSAVLLYGFSFLYGVGGSTKLPLIAAAIANPPAQADFTGLLVPLAMLLMFAGLAFRLTAVPFHFYAPDVYEGTSNANAGLLATLPKIVGLAVLARLLLSAMPGWESLGWKVALVGSVLTMTLGNVLALWQNNIRRLLAYSSIAHAGYMLIGVAVSLALRTTSGGVELLDKPFDGLGAAVFYLGVYMAATLGTFAALVYLSRGGRRVDTLDDLAGLNRVHPLVALMISAFMFSLTGIPPLAGFWGKFALLFGALTLDQPADSDAGLRLWFVGLAIVAVLNAAIAAAYYLRVIGVLYFRSPNEATARAGRSLAPALAMAVCAALVVGIGLLPGRFIAGSNRAGRSVGPMAGEAMGPVYAAKDTASPGLPQPQGGG